MNIGINCYPTHGGSGVVATELAKALGRRGHDVSMISYDLPFRLDEINDNVSYYEVTVDQYPLMKYFPYTLALASKMVEVVKEKDISIMHVHYAIPHSIAAILARDILKKERPLKVITTLHGTDITLVGNNASFRPITNYAIENSDAVTAVSQFLKKEVCRHFDVDCSRVEVIYNFFDTGTGQMPLPRCLAPFCCCGKAVVVHISNFRPVKRIEDVIKAFYYIWKEIPATLLMVGDGPDKTRASDLAQELGMKKDVHFMGVIKNIVPVINAANLLLLPSQTESFGLVILEGMSSGVPVVASDVGGIPEVVEHGITGYLAPAGDTEAMGKYGLKILTDKELYKNMSEAARKRAREKFHTEDIVSQYEKLYERVLMQ
ncbi:MAG: N-acetyl-alpha-D-glucosaminyl L-malate synthase BshA [Candidatus Eremiobacterota bacterium]